MKLPAWVHTLASDIYLSRFIFSSFSQICIYKALTVKVIWGKKHFFFVKCIFFVRFISSLSLIFQLLTSLECILLNETKQSRHN